MENYIEVSDLNLIKCDKINNKFTCRNKMGKNIFKKWNKKCEYNFI